jgi:hypothetical protein
MTGSEYVTRGVKMRCVLPTFLVMISNKRIDPLSNGGQWTSTATTSILIIAIVMQKFPVHGPRMASNTSF